MAQRETTILTTGVSGSGKSYARCARFLADEFLPWESGVVFTNFPINVREMCEFVGKNTGKTPEEYAKRIVLIPDDVRKSWLRGLTTPLDYFESFDPDYLVGAHIALDEAHNYASRNHPPKIRADYAEFCGELRHRKMTIEFLTQNSDKLAREINLEAGSWYEIDNSENRMDPVFKIKLYDWYQLYAGITGEYSKSVWQNEHRKKNSKWVLEHSKKYRIDAKYYKLYNSFNATEKGQKTSDKKIDEPFDKMSFPSLLLWFIERNAFQVAKMIVMTCMILFFLGGGGSKVFGFLMNIGSPSKIKTEKVDNEEITPHSEDEKKDVKEEESISEIDSVVAVMSDRLDEKDRIIREFKRKLEQVEKRIHDGSNVVMITPELFVMSDSLEYGMGDVIEGGKYEGKIVNEINYDKRKIILSSGDVLTFGLFNRMQDKYNANGGKTSFQGSVYGDQFGDEKGLQQNQQGKVDHVFSAGDGTSQIPVVPLQTDGRINHSEPISRRQDDHSRSQGAVSQRRSLGGRKAARRGDYQNRKPILPRSTKAGGFRRAGKKGQEIERGRIERSDSRLDLR